VSTFAVHPDGELIIRLRQGDLDALAELYEKYKRTIFRTVWAITRDQGAAEDILQESFLRLLTHAAQMRTDGPVGPWLYRVAVNQSYTWIQKHRRSGNVLDAVLEQLTAPLVAPPDRLVERREVQETVQQAIGKLPFDRQVVVVLFYLEGLGLKEIADVLQVPEGTVKSRLHYAREALRDLLVERSAAPEMSYEFT